MPTKLPHNCDACSKLSAPHVEIEIDRDPKLNRSSIPATHTPKQFQET
jgi:hypothetical protein